MFDIIKLSSHHKAKHGFQFLKAYVIYYKCGSFKLHWTIPVMRSHLHWTGHLWRKGPTIYEKCRQKYFSRLLKCSAQNISLFDSPFLWTFISRCLFPRISSILQSPLFIFPLVFPSPNLLHLEEGKDLKFPYPNFQKQNQGCLSLPYIAVSSSGKQSYNLRTEGNGIFSHWFDFEAFFLYRILKIYWCVQ